jgi:hypothetical protein
MLREARTRFQGRNGSHLCREPSFLQACSCIPLLSRLLASHSQQSFRKYPRIEIASVSRTEAGSPGSSFSRIASRKAAAEDRGRAQEPANAFARFASEPGNTLAAVGSASRLYLEIVSRRTPVSRSILRKLHPRASRAITCLSLHHLQVVGQGILRGHNPRACPKSLYPKWPLFRCSSVAGFGCSVTRGIHAGAVEHGFVDRRRSRNSFITASASQLARA